MWLVSSGQQVGKVVVMAIVAGDILRLTTQVDYLSQKCLQVWFYRADNLVGVPTYEGVADGFKAQYDLHCTIYLHPNAVLELVKVENLTNGVDIFSKGYNVPGTASNPGDPMPPYVTYSVRQLRGSKITRHGSKRFAGVPEGFNNGGSYSGGGSSPNQLVDFCAATHGAGSDSENNLQAVPVIVGRKLVTKAGGKTYYDVDLTKINSITGADFRGISTQNSRKFGRGI